MSQIIPEIVSQHAEEACFLWLLRNDAVYAPHYALADLGRLDARIESHLDDLRASGESGSEIFAEVLGHGGADEIFAAIVFRFATGHHLHTKILFELEHNPAALSDGLISALGWLSYPQAEQHICKLLSCSIPDLRRVGIAASGIHRRDPGQALSDALADEDLLLRARALRAVGELGRTDLLSSVQKNVTLQYDKSRFSAAWSAALLGDSDAISVLTEIAGLDVPYNEEAAIVAFRRMDLAAGLRWQRELAENPASVRLSVIGAGAIGDSRLVPWLIDQMKVPAWARVAGEAFTMITGVDIAYEDLEGEKPEGFDSGPTEDPNDENVEMDPDENLPWPNRELIQKWWSNHRHNFQNGTRYLIGKPITEEWLQQVLRIGRQRQRAAAALELVLKRPGQPLFEVRAPGFRQQQMLGLKVTR